MKNLIATICLFSLLFSCKSDQDYQDEFSGSYEVSIEAPEANKDLKRTKKDLQREMENAEEEITEGIEEAKKEIEKEFGDDSNIGKAISSFVEGMGHLANSMTDLGESLGNLGIDLGTDVLSNVNFNAEFQRDGEVVFGKKRGIRFRGNDLRWKYQNGKILLWNDDEDESDAEIYKIKKISEKEFDLIGEEVIFHLIKN